ncbi:MAG: hypothetical protein JXQ83_14540, partial [Candidatus Glassbacteria bacterium]|nr:hypothetical protein [Candidatus Glassbacteria bacterium]
IQTALERVAGPAKVSVVENGPVRAVLRVERSLGKSVFIQDITLTAGGRRVDVVNRIDWHSPGRLLKASFSLEAGNPSATYDLQLGVIERMNNTENLYEVPGHQWADITDSSGGFGLAVLNDCKYGWDKPADNRLRLTLIHTPIGEEDLDQGLNDFTWSLYPHEGGWREADVVREAARLNQPLFAMQVEQHGGPLGRSLSLLEMRGERVGLMALKKSEKGDRLVIRVRELDGKDREMVQLKLPRRIKGAWELNGQEDEKGGAGYEDRMLKFDIGGYGIKTLAVELD